ncbi:MAG TPA: hypothetical protein PLE75_01380 [Ferruginibacter sp.]|nr:hypothetical protein [Chitinophagaceae bacterium]HML58032.1 hypothetical protein [Ferruginibacter sp.]HRN90943.1 hypothetical protein [Ferruginibacter sp.]HRO05308.1 hypothetical protein [Ferruginibacter sp.]HRO96072.1 hypothetical protein [Ferruginibacter sp.]
MKNKIILLALGGAFFLGSCTSAYKSTQTPDDVYYSPLRDVKESKVEEEYISREDRQIRIGTRNPRWRYDDNWDYRYDPYRYGYHYGYYYNPYYYPYPVYSGITVRDPKNTTPRTTNLSTYSPQTLTTRDPKTGKVTTIRTRTYNQSNQRGETRRILRPSDNRSDYNNNRTYSPSSGGSRPSGGGGSTPVVRPPRP